MWSECEEEGGEGVCVEGVCGREGGREGGRERERDQPVQTVG